MIWRTIFQPSLLKDRMMLVLLFGETPVSLDTIAKDLFVAKSTAKLDMDKALAKLKEMHVAFENSQKLTYVVIPEKRGRLLACS